MRSIVREAIAGGTATNIRTIDDHRKTHNSIRTIALQSSGFWCRASFKRSRSQSSREPEFWSRLSKNKQTNKSIYLIPPPSISKMGANDPAESLISHASIKLAANALNTPPVATPPRSTTPPIVGEKRKSDRKVMADNSAQRGRATGTPGADAIDPNALSKALLKEFEDAGKTRDITPGGSPSRKRQRVYGDR